MATVLIVEDEGVMSDVQKEALTGAGFACDVAPNGIEAVKLLKRRSYDVIVTDIVMPRMDGFEFLKVLVGHPDWKRIPVIVLSNLSQASDRERCKSLGACTYLLKTQTSLEALVEEVKSRVGI